MSTNYVYFISSLPALFFGAKLPFGFNEFIARAESLLTLKDFDILKNLPTAQNFNKYNQHYLVKKFLAFDAALRNELVKLRAARLKINTEKYLRFNTYTGPAITHIALSAAKNPNILDAEKSLDEARWSYLDDLSFGHYFDLEFLIIYVYKLHILERWENIFTANKEKILEEVLWKNE